MTIATVWYRANEAHVVTDSLYFDGRREPVHVAAKVRILPHAGTVLIVRGPHPVALALEAGLQAQHLPEGVDSVLGVAPGLLEEAFRGYREDLEADGVTYEDLHAYGEERGMAIATEVEAFIVGYAPAARTFRAAVLGSSAGCEPREIPAGEIFAGPGVPGLRLGARKVRVPDDLINVAKAQHEAYPAAGGGELFHIAMRPKSITINRAHRFDDFDEVMGRIAEGRDGDDDQ